MATDVVEAINLSLLVSDQEELKASLFKAHPRTILSKPELVCDENPFLGEDGSSLKFVNFLRVVPSRGQSSNGVLGLGVNLLWFMLCSAA